MGINCHLLAITNALSGIQDSSNPTDDSLVTELQSPLQGEPIMHDLLIALACIGMIVAPAIVAATTDIDVSNKIE